MFSAHKGSRKQKLIAVSRLLTNHVATYGQETPAPPNSVSGLIRWILGGIKPLCTLQLNQANECAIRIDQGTNTTFP
jgi:hypothetical protein